MLQLKNIVKTYVTGELVQDALQGVSITFRENEFVSILGQSGSGKTTMLNIIGGLDRYTSGDLVINGVSTRQYKDADWDYYRNNSIGFVFQSYNLIPHQSVLANVELALTLSGVSRKERRQRALAVLEKVGLKDHIHKRPNQMSGGQMQRVAIARALINNPDILLADEPTGALDSETSLQIMELLKQIAEEKLVIMVTHNPELAESYSTRIVKLKDGKIIGDSDPYDAETAPVQEKKHKKISMSFLTSLALSFNNLGTKKARTLLTAFAGSIGIIGIAMILSLSTGVNKYIEDIQKQTMTSYPISIQEQAFDMSSIMGSMGQGQGGSADHANDGVYSNPISLEMMSTMTSSFTENNLTAFKKYLDDPNSEIHQYIGENGVVYTYDTRFSVFTYDPDQMLVNTDGSTLRTQGGMMGGGSPFSQIVPGQNGALISDAVKDYYTLAWGEWPKEANELVLVMNGNHEISAPTLYQLGLLPVAEYKQIMASVAAGEQVELETVKWSYSQIAQMEFYLVPECDFYLEQEDGTFSYVAGEEYEIKNLLDSAMKLKITAIVRPNEDPKGISINTTLGYTKALTDYIIAHTDDSPVVRAQRANPNVDVVSGLNFSPDDDAAKIADTIIYIRALGVSDKAALYKNIMMAQAATNPAIMGQLMGKTETELAAMMDAYLEAPDDKVLLSIYDTYISTGTYEENLEDFGVVNLDTPSSVNIYTDSFENKEAISDCIRTYNKSAAEEDRITYTDAVALLMGSVTTIVDVISYVLIAFVAVSLVVSSIMIGIITYISVLERTKEIGILRALGASKKNISQVFNAETFIIGLCSGLLGIGVTLLLHIPINAIIHALTDIDDVSAVLPAGAAVILVILSVILTLIGGLIPSRLAAKKDPVIALRTE